MARRKDREGFPLVAAFGLSVVLHLLLGLLTMLAPWLTQTVALEQTDEVSEITFTFVDRPELDDDNRAQEAAPDGNVPLPVPVEPAEPDPQELEELPPELLQDELLPAEEAVELEPPDLPEEQPLQQPDENTVPAPSEQAAEVEQRRMNVNDALRDFGEALSHRPPPPPTTQSDSPSNVIVPDLSQIPSSGFGVGNLTFESADYDWTDYGRQIYMAIWRAWHSRLYQTTGEFEKWAHQGGQWYLNNQAAVRFVIHSNGQVSGIAIEGRSGCGPLDASAADALAEVILPPLPSGFPRDTEIVHARFVAIGEIRRMRPSLRQLKAMGMF